MLSNNLSLRYVTLLTTIDTFYLLCCDAAIFWRDVDFRRSKLAVCTLCRVLYGTDYDCAFPNI